MLNHLNYCIFGRRRKTLIIIASSCLIILLYIGGIVQSQHKLEATKLRNPRIIHHPPRAPGIVVRLLNSNNTERRPSGISKPPAPLDEYIFMYGAYYDLRDPAGPKIRLLAIMDTKIITVAQILLRIDTQVLRIAEINVLADEAAHAFYFGCKYQEVDIVSEVYNGHLPNIISIHFNQASQTIPLQPLATNYDSGLTVCQKPLHWYHNWPQLFLFFESWRRYGTSKFLLSLHSVSIPTMKLIEYYKRLELVDFQWISQMPMVGGTDPNNALDWQGEHLFEQLCSYRSTTKYTAIADVDEFLAISNATDINKLLEALSFKEKDISLFRFETVPVALPENNVFGQLLLNLTAREYVEVGSDSKEERCIYRTEQTRLVGCRKGDQAARAGFANFADFTVPGNVAKYLHAKKNARLNFLTTPAGEKMKLFEKEHLETMQKTLFEIFDGKIPDYEPEAIDKAFEGCKNMTSQRLLCPMPTGKHCQEEMLKVGEWVLPSNKEGNVWTVV